MAIPTGTLTSSSTISALVTTAYDQYVRMALRSIPVMRALADVKPVQQAMPGSSVVFSIYSDLNAATGTLTETSDVDSLALGNPSTVSVTLNEYGNAVTTTKKLNLTSFNDVDSALADIIAYNAADSIDSVVASVLTGSTGTNVKPYAPNHLVYVGIVERSNAGNGQIYIKPQNGYELEELHNVSAQSPANNDGIFFNTSTDLWEKKSIATVLGYTPLNPTRSISTTSPLSGGGDLTADRTISIQDAAADGTTKGAAAFNANDFNSASGVISLDYTNGQSASAVNKGFLTSADWTTFNQKSGVFMHRIAPTAFNPLDATIYYAGDLSASLDWGTTAAARRHYVAASFELIAASIMVRVAGTIGSGESGTLAIRKNNTTDFTISTGVLMNAANVYVQATGLSGASFVSGDYFELKFTAPTWATNPTNVNLIVALYFR